VQKIKRRKHLTTEDAETTEKKPREQIDLCSMFIFFSVVSASSVVKVFDKHYPSSSMPSVKNTILLAALIRLLGILPESTKVRAG
jgi:hypothetical protein